MISRTPKRSAAEGRLDWVDTGRGLAILLVALYHSANWMASAGLSMEMWKTVNEVLSSLRMPLFFILSGLFARKWQDATWGDLSRVKIRLFAWVLCVWAVIGMGVTLIGYSMAGIGVSFRTALINIIRTPLLPPFELWFMWALIVFFVVSKLTRRIDCRVQLAGAAIVSSIAFSLWISTTTGWIGSLKYYFFFAAGLQLRSIILRFAGLSGAASLAVALTAWISVSLTLTLFGVRAVYPLYFINCIAGLFGGIAISRLLSRIRLLRWLGSRTLPIYLAHTPFIILMYAAVAQPRVQEIIGGFQQFAPPLVAVAAVGCALLLHRLTSTGPLRFLYEPPGRLFGGWHGRVGRSSSTGVTTPGAAHVTDGAEQ